MSHHRFYRSGHRLMHALLRPSNAAHTSVMHQSVKKSFTITFTSPAAMLASAFTQSAPIVTSSSSSSSSVTSSTVGGVRSSSTTSSSSGSSKGCGSPACCQGVTTITSGEDGEEPFIGAPSLSINTSTKKNLSSCSSSSSSQANDQNASINAASTSSPSPASTPSPPPRTKCDPYEQGGHPLTTSVVHQHMIATLDPAWKYDEEKKILVRSFEFGKTFRNQEVRGEDTAKLFAFVADLGNIQLYGSHSVYNLNLNLRSNSLQVMLRTVPLSGISYQDLILATKIDGMWFRNMQKKKAEETKRKRETQETPADGNSSKEVNAATLASKPNPSRSRASDSNIRL